MPRQAGRLRHSHRLRPKPLGIRRRNGLDLLQHSSQSRVLADNPVVVSKARSSLGGQLPKSAFCLFLFAVRQAGRRHVP